jgi:hypothetical protein
MAEQVVCFALFFLRVRFSTLIGNEARAAKGQTFSCRTPGSAMSGRYDFGCLVGNLVDRYSFGAMSCSDSFLSTCFLKDWFGGLCLD